MPYGLRAASRAADTLAFESAASLYGQALDLLDDTERTAELLENHADALANAGPPAWRQRSATSKRRDGATMNCTASNCGSGEQDI